MPTPSNAPYKLKQREDERRQKAARRVARVDRDLLKAATVRAAAETRRGVRGAEQRLHSLWAMLTRSERLELTGGPHRARPVGESHNRPVKGRPPFAQALRELWRRARRALRKGA